MRPSLNLSILSFLLVCVVAHTGACGDSGMSGPERSSNPESSQCLEMRETGSEAQDRYCSSPSECSPVACACADGSVVNTRSCVNGSCQGEAACSDACLASGVLDCSGSTDSTCEPSCVGKRCGEDDGCGGECSDCPSGQSCQDSRCVAEERPEQCKPDCAGKSCGDDDGCDGVCTACPTDETCDTSSNTCVSALGSCFLSLNDPAISVSCDSAITAQRCADIQALQQYKWREFVRGCDACSESCAPSWWDCAGVSLCMIDGEWQ